MTKCRGRGYRVENRSCHQISNGGILNQTLAFTDHKTEKINSFGQKLTCCGHFEVARCQILEIFSKIVTKSHICSKYGPSEILNYIKWYIKPIYNRNNADILCLHFYLGSGALYRYKMGTKVW